MKKAIEGFETAALFVGSVVGAGFATGREIILFFGESGVAGLAVAALFMAVCAFAFMDMGARGVRLDPRLELSVDTVVAVASFAVYAAMIAAAESVLAAWTGRKGLSVPIALFVMLFAGKRMAWVSRLNLVAVPLMAALIVLVGSRSAGRGAGEGIDLLRSLAYGGMNLLFSGALMRKEGARLTLSARIVASVLSGVVIFLMMYFLWRSVRGDASAEMPFLAAASREGLGTVALLALLLAIVTTMASTAFLVTDRVNALFRDPVLSSSLVTLFAVLLSSVGFSPLVTYTYPVVSYLGLAATGVAILMWFYDIAKSFSKE